jgi:tRNA dimethylallyltransferase
VVLTAADNAGVGKWRPYNYTVPNYRVLTGPTASGKTDWLLRRAERVPIRVISADSRQVYRHMDIGTGKPNAEELAKLPHYGIDLVNPLQSFSAHEFILMAAAALRELEDFAAEVWVSGGTGLYIRTLTEALPLGPAPRPQLREALAQLIQDRGSAAVASELALDLREVLNPVRVLRQAEKAAAENPSRIYSYAGLDPGLGSTDQPQWSNEYGVALAQTQAWQCEGVFVMDPVAELDKRIARRVEGMFAQGLVQEVRDLRAMGYGAASVVAEGIAYKQAGALLDGTLSKPEALRHAVIRTRQYAKRQRTYFRGRGWQIYTQAELDAAVPLP